MSAIERARVEAKARGTQLHVHPCPYCYQHPLCTDACTVWNTDGWLPEGAATCCDAAACRIEHDAEAVERILGDM